MIGYRAGSRPPELPGGGASGPLRVATVITRLDGGAGVLALRGAQALDPEAAQLAIVAGSGGRLLDEAAASGIEVVVEPLLREVIAPRADLLALRKLETLFRERNFDVVHTHCAKAGAVGRVAARRAAIPRIVHTFHGFPFHEFQSVPRRQAYLSIERRLGRITDVALCVGAAVAAEAVRRELAAPERIRTIGVAVDGPDRAKASMSALLPEARRRARATLGLPADAAVVGAVGRLTYQKAPGDFARGASRVRRLRAAQPLRGPAHRDRRGHDLRRSGRRERRERRARPRGTGRDRHAGAAAAARLAGRGRPVSPRLARGRGPHGRGGPRSRG